MKSALSVKVSRCAITVCVSRCGIVDLRFIGRFDRDTLARLPERLVQGSTVPLDAVLTVDAIKRQFDLSQSLGAGFRGLDAEKFARRLSLARIEPQG